MCNKPNKISDTKEDKLISDQIDDSIGEISISKSIGYVSDTISEVDDLDKDSRYFIAISHAGQNSTYINDLVEKIICAFPEQRIFYDKKDFLIIESEPQRKSLFRKIFLEADYVLVFMSKEYSNNSIAQEEFSFIWQRYCNNPSTNGIVWISCDGEVSEKLTETSIPANMMGRSDAQILDIIKSRIIKSESAKLLPQNAVKLNKGKCDNGEGLFRIDHRTDYTISEEKTRLKKALSYDIDKVVSTLFNIKGLSDETNNALIIIKQDLKSLSRQEMVEPASDRVKEMRSSLTYKIIDLIETLPFEIVVRCNKTLENDGNRLHDETSKNSTKSQRRTSWLF